MGVGVGVGVGAGLGDGEGLNSTITADYRGYGVSGGQPNFSTMLADAHRVLAAFHETLASDGYSDARFVMGRSLGTLPALELAAHSGTLLRGLIIESGTAGTGDSWLRFLPPGSDSSPWQELNRLHLAKVRSITLPLLSIHGQRDELIPLDRAVELQEVIGSKKKELVVIPGAGHNDVMCVGMQEYFAALSGFIPHAAAGGAD